MLVAIVILLVIVALIASFVIFQYMRIRKSMPKPKFKHPARRLDVQKIKHSDVAIGWIGHSTVYLNIKGKIVITDPIFSDRIGVSPIPGWTIGPKRHTGPAADVPDVLHPDLILLSHAHMDHFDFPSLRKLAHWETSVVTARGTGHLLRRMKFESVRELAPGDTCVAEGVKVTAVGVRHWGNRFPWNHDYGFNGYVMEYGGSRIFYAGDTAHTESFRALQDMWPIDIAIMPIGAYAPDSFQGSHCTPEQAWEMFLDTGAKYLVPVHWDTFVLSQEPVDEPMKRLLEAAGDDRDRIVIREHGQMFELPPDV